MQSTTSTGRTGNTVSDELLQAFERAMPRSTSATFATREAEALALMNALGRAWFEAELVRAEAQWTETVTVDGKRYRRHERGGGRYYSLCGTIEVERHTYRQIGVHNGPTVVPLELEMGLIEGATPALAFSVAQGYASMPLREYEQEMRAAHREPPSRSTLERLGKQLGGALRAAMPKVEADVRAAEEIPAEAVSMSIGLDRTTVPMAEARATGRSIEPRRKRTKPYCRQPPAPVDVAYRMAYVGTIAIHDQDGGTLVSRRFAASAAEGPAKLLESLFAEVEHVLAQRPGLPLAVVQDGAPELWNLVGEACRARGLKPAAEVIDRYHLDERLAAVIDLIAGCDRSAVSMRERWARSLNNSDSAIDRISRELDHLYWYFAHDDPPPRGLAPYLRKVVKGGKVSELVGHIEYVCRNRRRLRYASAIRRGLPQGSGVTEGACKSVVTTRFKRSGQRWYERGLSACLALRAMHLNQRLRPCFDRLAPSYSREVRSL